MNRILFVCLGNICRSSTAEGVARALAARRGQKIDVDSAGTSDWHIGAPPHPPAVAAAVQRGIDLSTLSARQFTAGDFFEFDLIIAMDRDNAARIETLRPTDCTTPVRLMLDFAPGTGRVDVPDPYYTGDYQQALNLIEGAATGLLDQLAQNALARAENSL